MARSKQFEFAFSLEVLNHLGRGLYRSFATVIAEAVSNSWDADATLVSISIGKDRLVVEDNGKGMDDIDFQNKFLKVGYSRRLDNSNRSKRSVIGRKGIGKLAMLSISKKVTVVTRKKLEKVTGGIINNIDLDKEIKKDGNYALEILQDSDKKVLTKNSGTKLIFEGMRTRLNGEEVIRKYLATQFNFIFSLRKNDKFTIKVNGKNISENDLKELHDNTQFVWFLGRNDEKRKRLYHNLKNHRIINNNSFTFNGENIEIRGFIASVVEPKHLILSGSSGSFKASINLFANGRLRQENLFEEISSKRLPEEYLYGEIHVDGFEDDKIDRFTSSREGIIKDDPLYQKFLDELKRIQNIILNDWSPWRKKVNDEGEINADRRPGYEVRMEDSRNRRAKDFQKKIDESIKDSKTKKGLKDRLRALSYKNTLVYQDLFILENIFREYIKIRNIKETDFIQGNTDEEDDIIQTLKEIRNLRKQAEERHALKGKIVKEEHFLNDLHLFHLGEIIDSKILKSHKTKKRYRKSLELDTKEIEPIRNRIMHTNEITDDVLRWDKIKNVIDYIERLRNKSSK